MSQRSGVEGLWGSIMSITEYFLPHFAELLSKREHRLHLVPTSGKARDLALLFSHAPQTAHGQHQNCSCKTEQITHFRRVLHQLAIKRDRGFEPRNRRISGRDAAKSAVQSLRTRRGHS